MNKRLGISIYPEIVGKEKTIEYIKLAHKYGFVRIFANLLELKDDKEGNAKLKMLASVYKFANDLGFEVIVDVNPNFYKDFKLKNTEIEFFRKLNVTGIRLDEGFRGVVESELSNNKYGMKVELNASASTQIIDETLEKGGNPKNIIACHNFYPMRFTGLDKNRFIQLSAHCNAKGIRVAAFVTLPEKQKGVGPWNVNEGMPTLEEDRDKSLEDQVRHLLSLEVVDDIIISQQGTTEAQFKKVASVMKEYLKITSSNITLNVKLQPKVGTVEKDIMFINKKKEHFNRHDFNSFFVRSTYPRIDYKAETIKPSNSGKKLKRGDVVVLNENLGRYKGELHIILNPIDDSKLNARNLVGKVVEKDLNKLMYIKSGTKFNLKETK